MTHRQLLELYVFASTQAEQNEAIKLMNKLDLGSNNWIK